jgi:hypothetical protein
MVEKEEDNRNEELSENNNVMEIKISKINNKLNY